MRPGTFRRLIANLCGIRRRRLAQCRRDRKWKAMFREHAAMQEAVLNEPDYYRRIDLADRLFRHRMDMKAFQMSEER